MQRTSLADIKFIYKLVIILIGANARQTHAQSNMTVAGTTKPKQIWWPALTFERKEEHPIKCASFDVHMYLCSCPN